MTDVEISDGNLVVTIEGLHRLWALRRRITVPLAHVEGAEYDPELARNPGWLGLRAPGTYWPGKIRAGQFYRFGYGWDFWDVSNPDQAIVVKLRDERFKRLVIEVADPQAAIAKINAAIGQQG